MTLKKKALYFSVLCIAAYFLFSCEQAMGPVTKTGTEPVTETEGKSTVLEFTVTVDPNLSYGAIVVEPPKAAEGAEITLTVTPQEDYYLEEGYPVLMDVKGGNASPITGDPETLVFVFPMPAHDVLVSASFAKIPNGLYAVTIDPSVTNGTITASAAESKERKTITVTLAPDPQMQYHSGSLKVNNGEVNVRGSKPKFTFTMPAKDVVISAEFKPPNSINTADEFLQIGRTADFPLDEIYELNADITLSEWTPPDSEKSPFTGVIYGKGKTITLGGFSSSALDNASHLGIFAYLRSAVVQDLTIIGASGPISATDGQYYGLLAGYTESATLKNIAVTGNLDVTRTSGVLYLGGVAGYMQGGSLENDLSCGISSVSVTGKTTGGTAYGGGIVGYAKNSAISGAHTTGNVTVTGEGHNTSAGGLCAYSDATKISGCSAAGNISLIADSHGLDDLNHLYMTYAGGLVGESVHLGATITKSYATGTVYAKSPYPYAGGLCGYNYGDSVIAECYATGPASAESQGALPYAGGLSGYNSNDAVIRDSWAAGPVAAVSTGSSGLAGGIVASNAKDAIISRCYSLSAVSSSTGSGDMPEEQPGISAGGSVGGISGHTYYTQYAKAPLTKIENCAALNSSLTVSGTSAKVHRITGSIADGAILSNNKGRADMDWTPGPEPADKTPNGLDGADCVAKPDEAVFATLGWDFSSVWAMGSNGYPVLRWQ